MSISSKQNRELYKGLQECLEYLRLAFKQVFKGGIYHPRFKHEPTMNKYEKHDLLERAYLKINDREQLKTFFRRYWELRHLSFKENKKIPREYLLDICQLPEPMSTGKVLLSDEDGNSKLEIGSIIATPVRYYGILIDRLETTGHYAVLVKENHANSYETVLLRETSLEIAQVRFQTVQHEGQLGDGYYQFPTGYY